MGGLSREEIRARPDPNRAKRLKYARDTFTERTGREPTDVRKAGLYKDFTSLEKKQYASLMKKKKKSIEGGSRLDQAESYVRSLKTLLGG